MKNYLKDIREDRDIKQQELAKVLNVSTAQYCRLENKLSTLSIDQAIILANYLNVSLDELVGRKVESNVSLEYATKFKDFHAIDTIKLARKKCNYTQSDIAKILGIRQTTYSDIENKRIQLKADDLIKICCFLGLTLDAFLNNYDIKTIALSKNEIESISSIYKKIKNKN